ncbi:MAG TPA: hypothetical protein PKC73_02525 [Dermatophilaceae bacterium]|jgi:hypothetical protein|nr:hypothetical protein [Actinomycetales bacterium]HMT88489.1 hypothetical protein [Dermatophilaceae bacterium]
MTEIAPSLFRGNAPWLRLPLAEDLSDVDGWAREAAHLVAEAQGFTDDKDALERVTFGLRQLVEIEALPGFVGRVLFAPDINDGSIVVHLTVAAVQADSVSDQRALLGIDDVEASADINGQVDDLRALGVEGYQILRVDEMAAIHPPPGETSNVKVLAATLSTVVRREVPGLGVVDVVALTQSTELVIVFAALVPIIDLLLGDDLMHVLGGA